MITNEQLTTLKFGDKVYKVTELGLQEYMFICFEPKWLQNKLLNPNGEFLPEEKNHYPIFRSPFQEFDVATYLKSYFLDLEQAKKHQIEYYQDCIDKFTKQLQKLQNS